MNKGIISNIQFGLLSEDQIRAISAIEITSHKIDEQGSICDPRLGAMSTQSHSGFKATKEICATCKLDESKCAGHFGFVKLKFPIIHPLFSKYVLKILRMFCYNCARFLYFRVNDYFPPFEQVTIEKTICPRCCSPQPVWSFVDDALRVKFAFQEKEIIMMPSELRIMLMNFDKEDLRRISFTTSPENLIITLLPVCPPCVRPPLYIDGQLHDDHLTIQYNEIVKININLPDDPREATLADLKKLTYKITNLFVEKSGGSSAMGSVTKPVIKRISGKKGHMRDSIMGKRVDRSGRTVIGPEPTLLINQIGIPEEMARVLTTKEIITDYNIDLYNRLIHTSDRGKVHFIYRKENNQVTRSFNTAYIKPYFRLQIGDELDRELRDGDPVITNRQPTLHKGSSIAFNTVVQSGRTIRFNLSNTKTFNADFDGDEMNIHIPQLYAARCELEELSSIKNHLLSERNGKPNIVLVQDNILALYLMTHENAPLAREELWDLTLYLVDEHREPWSFERIADALERMQAYFGQEPVARVVISLCLPENFDFIDGDIEIKKGIFAHGIFDKGAMNKIFDIIYHLYPSETSEMVVNNLQRLSNQWLRLRSFSIGLEDCIVKDKQLPETIRNLVEKSFYEAAVVEETTINKRIQEVKVQDALNRAQAVGLRITKEGFAPTNNFIHMIKSGSKGDYFNVAQISGLLGQQYIKGARITPDLNNGSRTLYHYPFELTGGEVYRARGFITSNFFGGLDPRAIYFHGEAGRAGVVDTAMGTSETGYMHRRIIKLMEDLKICYDGTVRDDMNIILQPRYGNGFEITSAPEPKMIRHLVASLNNDYEKLNE